MAPTSAAASRTLVLALYRSLVRSARVLDRHREFKALLPREVVWDGGQRRVDFFTTNASCVEALRREFRRPRADAAAVSAALDEALVLNKGIGERVHLLFADERDQQLLPRAQPPPPVSFDDTYSALRQCQRSPEDAKALDDALQLVRGAADVLRSEEMGADDKARIAKAYYAQSIELFPTADAHAYLGWHLYLDGELERAATECARAIELDPAFGNAYNDLGLIRVQQGMDEEAAALFTQAKLAPRYDVRHFPSLNLAALHLEHDRIKPALHEYIEALRWMQPDEAVAIRNTVADIGTFIVTVAEKLRSTG
ncbi:hypothetical protein PybrP1_004693 [[Pythium] brassicae (nom. inval.)]|nr:hypothetical protein PybrP1_004693 [[Pythium] brassicae (nom. inval.)]